MKNDCNLILDKIINFRNFYIFVERLKNVRLNEWKRKTQKKKRTIEQYSPGIRTKFSPGKHLREGGLYKL